MAFRRRALLIYIKAGCGKAGQYSSVQLSVLLETVAMLPCLSCTSASHGKETSGGRVEG